MRSVFVPPLVAILLAAALPCLPGDAPLADHRPSAGALFWRNGTFTLYLMEQPCASREFAADLEDAGIPPARASLLVQAGRATVQGCWAADVQGDVLTRDAGGSDGMVPASWFQRLPDGA
jgi:hypothetical protein